MKLWRTSFGLITQRIAIETSRKMMCSHWPENCCPEGLRSSLFTASSSRSTAASAAAITRHDQVPQERWRPKRMLSSTLTVSSLSCPRTIMRTKIIYKTNIVAAFVAVIDFGCHKLTQVTAGWRSVIDLFILQVIKCIRCVAWSNNAESRWKSEIKIIYLKKLNRAQTNYFENWSLVW